MKLISVTKKDPSGNIIYLAYDKGANGVNNYIERRTFDGMGHLLSEEFDRNADKIIDEKSLFTYDMNGNLTQRLTDYDGNGTWDVTVTNQFDDLGRLVKFMRVSTQGSGPASITIETYDYSDNIITWHRTIDYDDNGVVDDQSTWRSVETIIYGQDGTKTVRHDIDGNRGGPADSADWIVFDTEGRAIWEFRDSDLFKEGVDESIHYEYDSAGNLLLRRKDIGTPPITQSRYTASYSSSGHKVEEVEEQWVRSHSPDRRDGLTPISRIRYDSLGRPLTEERDLDFDGSFDNITSQWYYDCSQH